MDYGLRAKNLLNSYKSTLNIKDIDSIEEERLLKELSKKLEDMDSEIESIKIEDELLNEEPEAFIPYHKISLKEKKALHRYINFGYEDINKDLRAGKSNSEIVAILDSLIEKQKIPESCIVFRIVEKSDIFEDSFVEQAFLSTSTDKEYLESQETNYEDSIILKINVPLGTPYARTRDSWEDDFESEILFPRNCFLEKIEKYEFRLKCC